VPEGLKRFPDKAREVNAIYCFKVAGEGGGEWMVDCTADPPTVVKGDTGAGQCTIEVTHDDFKSMLADPNAGMQLYFQGRLRVSGDPMLAMKLQQFCSMASGRAPRARRSENVVYVA
jgi:putative sterol carrier protein